MHKVLIVFNHPAPYKVKLFNELAKHVDLTVIFERNSASDRNKTFYEEKNYNFKTVKIHGLKVGKENFISTGITKHLKHNKYDLILMNGYSQIAEMNAINYLIKYKIPYVLYINGGIIKQKETRFKKNLKRKYISHASFYLSPDEISNNYLFYYGADKAKIFNYPYSTIYQKEVLSNAIDDKTKCELRQKAKVNEEKVFVSCGQLIKRKNYFELIQKWQELDSKYGLYIIGDGKQKNYLEQYIKGNQINNVHLLGYMKRSEVFNFYHLSDIFIFPSDEDIYGHVINEAMSQGLPVISTPNVNASQKLIRNGNNGFIISSLKTDEIKNAIKNLLDKNLGENAISTAKENTIEKMADSHIKIFERIMTK